MVVRGMAIVGMLAVAATAHAESAAQLTATARSIAQAGECSALPAIGRRVAELDADYYARVYAVDPLIAACHDAPEPKSPGLALAFSLIPTVGGALLATVGDKEHSRALGYSGAGLVVIGPTLGHAYAGDAWNAGLELRGAGVLAFVVGGAIWAPCFDNRCDDAMAVAGGVLMLLGATGYVAGTAWEIGSAPGAATRYNREHERDVTLVLSGSGVAIAGRF